MPKCRYKHCKHEGTPVDETGVRVGNAYYHKDCFEEKENINRIIDFYVNNFDPEPIFTSLRKTINNIVYGKKKDPLFVLFALRYAKSNNIKINHPGGIYYVLKNENMLEAWKKHTTPVVRQEDFKPVEDNGLEKVEGYNNFGKRNGFSRILGSA